MYPFRGKRSCVRLTNSDVNVLLLVKLQPIEDGKNWIISALSPYTGAFAKSQRAEQIMCDLGTPEQSNFFRDWIDAKKIEIKVKIQSKLDMTNTGNQSQELNFPTPGAKEAVPVEKLCGSIHRRCGQNFTADVVQARHFEDEIAAIYLNSQGRSESKDIRVRQRLAVRKIKRLLDVPIRCFTSWARLTQGWRFDYVSRKVEVDNIMKMSPRLGPPRLMRWDSKEDDFVEAPARKKKSDSMQSNQSQAIDDAAMQFEKSSLVGSIRVFYMKNSISSKDY